MEFLVEVVNILLIHVISLTETHFIIIEETFITSIEILTSSISITLLEVAVGKIEEEKRMGFIIC